MNKKRKFYEPIKISIRKAGIFLRRDDTVSSLEESHALLVEADPGLIETVEHKRVRRRKQKQTI